MWLPLSTDDLRTGFSPQEWDILNTLIQPDVDEIGDILRRHVAGFRGLIMARNKVGPEGTLPDAARMKAIPIIRVAVLNRFPDVGLISEDRREAAKEAQRWFDNLKAGDVRYPETDEPITASPSTGAVLVHANRLRFDRRRSRFL